MIDVHDLSHHSRQCLRFALLVIVGASFVITSAYFLARPASTTRGLGVRGPATTAMAETSLPSESRMNEAYGRLPLSFETNQGQTDGRVKFISHGGGYTLFLTSNEAVLQLRKAKHGKQFDEDKNLSHQQTRRTSRITSSALRMRFVGANDAAEITGEDELAGKTNYFIGNDAAKWRANIANFARV